ncbi:MAG: hypothetical protein KQI35_11105 [Bacteroidetes bacterium]|nr:hypothetical protein [Bacteroidota bacterium]
MGLNYYVFLKKLIVYTLILGALGYGIAYFLPKEFITPTLPFLYVFFFSATMIIHYILLRVSQKKTSGFINYFMLLTFGKLIFFLTIILVYALVFRDDAIPFIISFFILYFFFTLFEIIQSLKHNKSGKKTTGNPANP